MNLATAALQGKAVGLLEVLKKTNERYYKASKAAHKIIGNKSLDDRFNVCDSTLEEALVDFLDFILGDEIASYYLYEICFMPEGGKIRKGSLEWRIKTWKDVLKYVNDNNGV